MIPDLTGLTPEELAAVAADAQTRLDAARDQVRTIEQTTRRAAATDVDALINLIGPPVSEAVPGEDTINALLANTNADINGNSAKYHKATWRLLRQIVKALVRGLRLTAGRLDSTSTGN